MLSRRTTDGNSWYTELSAAVKSMNASKHSSLFMREPDDVIGDKELRFELRYKNAEMRQENVQLAKPLETTCSSKAPSERSCGRPLALSDEPGSRTGARRYTRLPRRATTAEW